MGELTGLRAEAGDQPTAPVFGPTPRTAAGPGAVLPGSGAGMPVTAAWAGGPEAWGPAGPGAAPGYDAAHPPRPGVGPLRAFSALWRNYGTFTGRASRSEFWWAFAEVALGHALFFVVLAWVSNWHSDAAVVSAGMKLILIAWLIYLLVALFPCLAVLCRRLHDAGYSGHWLWLGILGVGRLVLLVFAVLSPNPSGVRFDAEDGTQPHPRPELASPEAGR